MVIKDNINIETCSNNGSVQIPRYAGVCDKWF